MYTYGTSIIGEASFLRLRKKILITPLTIPI